MSSPLRTAEVLRQVSPASHKGIDLGITLLLWAYFTLGFIVLFAPLYLVAAAFPPFRMCAFQRLNHYFYRGFFLICRLLIPRQQWRIDEAVPPTRSSVIVCNHISYIDPILLISLFKRHTTIVKAGLFQLPVFGMMLKLSGYIPSASDGPLAEVTLRRMGTLCRDLAQGANLIVFPEGTRSRTGVIGKLNPGAFKIARLCRAPIKVIFIRNSDRLFRPGRFLFDTRCSNTIAVESIGELNPNYDGPDFSVAGLLDQVQRLMEAHRHLTIREAP